jgi:hypothetical protein
MRDRVRRWIAAACLAAVGATAIVAVSPGEPSAAAGTGTLSLYKAIENLATGSSEGDRGKWDVQAVNVDTGQTIRTNGLNGFQSRVIPAGSYVISEQPNDRTPAGYRFRDWNCGGTVITTPEPTITLAEGQNLTCTVTNVAVQPTLTLRKVVEGGSAPPSLWTLRAMDGPTFVGGVANSPAVTARPVGIGTYRLVEEGPGAAQGYTASAWSCTWANHLGQSGDLPVDASGHITIALDQAVTCTITNTSEAPTLTLVKQLVASGGPAHAATDWTLSATPSTGTGISGPSGSAAVSHVSVESGIDYVLGESGPSGYTSSGWSCVDASGADDFTLAGDVIRFGGEADVTCTIVNTFAGGWLTLEKHVVDSDQPSSSWTLTATGTAGDAVGTTVAGASGTPAVTTVPVPTGDYALSEAGPGGYDTVGFICGGGSPTSTVTIAAGAHVTCAITNVRPTTLTQLTLVKEVDNAGGGPFGPTAWGVEATGGTPPQHISGITGLSTVTYRIVSPGHYVLGEAPRTSDPRYADYAFEGWTCFDTLTGIMPVSGAGGNEVDIPEGAQVRCTVRNSWQGALISFSKQVVNEPYGSNEPVEWQLEVRDAEGDVVIAGDGGGGATGISQRAIDPGRYELVEASGPDGYEGPFFHCVGDADGAPDDAFVTIEASTVVSCTATNRAIPPRVTLEKSLDNTGGGTAAVADFTLKARGPGDAAIAGPSGDPAVTLVPLPPGEYVFSEDGPAGYAVDWDCVGATSWDDAAEVAVLGAGDTMVCTATNTVVPPRLTLVKEVEGGPASVTDWELSATGPDGAISGVSGEGAITDVAVDAGVYLLAEAPVAGAEDRTDAYVPGAWECTAGELSGSELTLAPGDDATCTIVNSWQGGVLTLAKLVADGRVPGGGGGVPGDWTLHADGPAIVDGPGGSAEIVEQPVPAGEYALYETLTAGPVDPDYHPGDWVCEGTGFALDEGDPGEAQLTIEAGADVACTLVNLYRPPHVTLAKEVVGAGPLAASADWTLSFTGASSGSGVTGDDAVTGVAVGSGTYTLAEEPADADLAIGYAPGTWSCTGGSVTDGGDGTAELVLTPDDLDVVCTVENRWTGSRVALVKTVDDGRVPPDPANPASDWTLAAVGPDAELRGAGTVQGFLPPGEYALGESPTAGATIDPDYRPGAWSCTTAAGIELEAGAPGEATLTIGEDANADVTCTIENVFLPPHLTLVKEVVGGGPRATPGAWELSFENPTTGRSGSGAPGEPSITDAAVGSGVVTLSETPDPLYESGAWTCEGAANDVSPTASGVATIELSPTDRDVTCTIRNTWIGGQLTLVKEVRDGGLVPETPAQAADWRLHAVGSEDELDVAGSGSGFLASGDYALSESANTAVDPGYRPGAWSCTPASALTPGDPGTGTVSLEPGSSVTCTLANLFQPPHLTLEKVVDGGPLATTDDWTLVFASDDGTRAGIGRTGEPAVTDVAVGAGSFSLRETPTDPSAQARGYTTAGWTCDGLGEVERGPDGTATVVLDPADLSVTCTIENSWSGGTLTLVKNVVGGTAAPGDWMLTASGPTALAGTSGQPAITSAAVLAGSYVLAEAPVPDRPTRDYVSDGWVCEGATLASDTVVVEPGTDVTCTVTNRHASVPPPAGVAQTGTDARGGLALASVLLLAGVLVAAVRGLRRRRRVAVRS